MRRDGVLCESLTPASFALHQVGVLDVDICGPTMTKLLDVQGHPVVDSPYGWIPLKFVLQEFHSCCDRKTIP